MEYLEGGEFGQMYVPVVESTGWNDELQSDDGNAFDGFEEIEARQQQTVDDMLLMTEFEFFEEQVGYEEALERNRIKQAAAAESSRPRYFSEGYEANVDAADQLEFARWQSRFCYLHVVGEGEVERPEPAVDHEFGNGSAAGVGEGDDYLEKNAAVSSLDQDFLSISGRKAIIYDSSIIDTEPSDKEEVICMEGTLAETIYIHSQPIFKEQPPDIELEQRKKEVAHELWKSSVLAMEPLVREIVRQKLLQKQLQQNL